MGKANGGGGEGGGGLSQPGIYGSHHPQPPGVGGALRHLQWALWKCRVLGHPEEETDNILSPGIRL